MKFIFKDLIYSIKTNRGIYVVIFISQIIGVIGLLISFNTYHCYKSKLNEIEISSDKINIQLDNICIGELRNELYELLNKIENELDFIYVLTKCDGKMINLHFEYHNGNYYVSETIKRRLGLSQGRYFTNQEMMRNDKVLIVGDKFDCDSDYVLDGTIYRVIGCTGTIYDKNVLWGTFTSCLPNLDSDQITFVYKSLPTLKSYSIIKDWFEDKWNNKVSVQKFELIDAEEMISIRTMIFMALMVGVVIAFSTGMLYGYLIRKRIGDQIVFAIVGASKKKRVITFIGEMGIICCISESVGISLYYIFIYEILSKKYEIELKDHILLAFFYYLIVMCIISIGIIAVNNQNIKKMFWRIKHD